MSRLARDWPVSPAALGLDELGGDRPSFTGSRAHVMDDIRPAEDIGVDQLILDLPGTARTTGELTVAASELMAAVGVAATVVRVG